MQVPLELSFRNIQKDDALEADIRRRVDKLERFCDHISSCRVAIERAHSGATPAGAARVRIDLMVPPGHELVVDKEARGKPYDEDLAAVIQNAFDAAQRQLKDLSSRQRHEVKTHAAPIAFVTRMLPDEDYGFLRTPDGREIYFHRNSVVGNDWSRLEVGTQVRLEETMGNDGPQATTVQIIDKPGGGNLPDDGRSAVEAPLGWERDPAAAEHARHD